MIICHYDISNNDNLSLDMSVSDDHKYYVHQCRNYYKYKSA